MYMVAKVSSDDKRDGKQSTLEQYHASECAGFICIVIDRAVQTADTRTWQMMFTSQTYSYISA